MKRLFEGATATTIVFFLIIVIGGFIFGTSKQVSKAYQKSSADKRVEKTERKKDQKYHDLKKNTDEEIEHLKKMNDPLWHYWDEKSESFLPIPGRYNVDVPVRPRENNG